MTYYSHRRIRPAAPIAAAVAMTPDKIIELQAKIDAMGSADREFALSLCNQHGKSGRLSEKQWYWVNRLIEKADAPPPAPIQVGALDQLHAMFDKAATKLKHPKLKLVLEGGQDVRLARAGSASKWPGSIIVTSDAAFGSNTYFGRVSKEGEFVASAKNSTALTTQLTDLMIRVATEPGAIGKMMGHCIFCRLPLTDDRSKAVGYGSKCSENWNLPWGK